MGVAALAVKVALTLTGVTGTAAAWGKLGLATPPGLLATPPGLAHRTPPGLADRPVAPPVLPALGLRGL